MDNKTVEMSYDDLGVLVYIMATDYSFRKSFPEYVTRVHSDQSQKFKRLVERIEKMWDVED